MLFQLIKGCYNNTISSMVIICKEFSALLSEKDKRLIYKNKLSTFAAKLVLLPTVMSVVELIRA